MSTLLDLLEAGYAKSTPNKYKPAWELWLKRASEFEEVKTCPADPLSIALHFNEMANKGGKVGAIVAAHSGIRWAHINAGSIPPTEHPSAKLAFEGAKRIAPKNTTKTKKNPWIQKLLSK